MKNSLSALDYFAAKLAYEITPEDLAAAQASGSSPTLVDSRPRGDWKKGRIPEAINIPYEEMAEIDPNLLPDEDADIVVYSWGPEDHSAARAAITLVKLGYTQVRELCGGFYSWEDGGFDIESDVPGRHSVSQLGEPKAG